MKYAFPLRWILWSVLFFALPFPCLQAQDEKTGTASLAETERLVVSRKFVFQVESPEQSGPEFFVIDSTYAEIQYRGSSTLEGKLTRWKAQRNDKRKTLTVTCTLRSLQKTYEIYFMLEETGQGKATLREESAQLNVSAESTEEQAPSKSFSMNGSVVGFNDSKASPWNPK